MVFDEHGEFGDLATAEVGGLIGTFAALRQFRDHLRAGGLGKAAEFVQRVLRVEWRVEQHPHEHRPFALHAVGPAWLRHS